MPVARDGNCASMCFCQKFDISEAKPHSGNICSGGFPSVETLEYILQVRGRDTVTRVGNFYCHTIFNCMRLNSYFNIIPGILNCILYKIVYDI